MLYLREALETPYLAAKERSDCRKRMSCVKVSYQVEFWIVVVLNILGLLYLTYGWLTNDWRLNVLRDWIWSVSEQGESYIEIRPLE